MYKLVCSIWLHIVYIHALYNTIRYKFKKHTQSITWKKSGITSEALLISVVSVHNFQHFNATQLRLLWAVPFTTQKFAEFALCCAKLHVLWMHNLRTCQCDGRTGRNRYNSVSWIGIQQVCHGWTNVAWAVYLFDGQLLVLLKPISIKLDNTHLVMLWKHRLFLGQLMS